MSSTSFFRSIYIEMCVNKGFGPENLEVCFGKRRELKKRNLLLRFLGLASCQEANANEMSLDCMEMIWIFAD